MRIRKLLSEIATIKSSQKYNDCARKEMKVDMTTTYLVVISKGPVAKHFEKRMMVIVLSHVIQIVVFAAGSNAFLRVHYSGSALWYFFETKKNRFELKLIYEKWLK